MTRIDPSEAVAIVGLGGIFPKALDMGQFWENVRSRRDCVVEVPKDRWDWRLYYDPNPAAPDKTYSKIGGFVEGFTFDPLKLRIPPPVAAQMDTVQHMAVAATAEALKDAAYDKRPFNPERTAVILGNSMGGTKKEMTDLRVYASYYVDRLARSKAFAKLPAAAREQIARELETEAKASLGTITEDTMPGELSNVIAGRVANAFNFNGANITVDAACASSLAALTQAMHGLRFHEYDVAISGGVDQMMSAPAYVKFCKIGALSPDGSRPFDAGANGFVMGEGAGVFVLKRLSDALKDGDRIYALLRASGSSSDGRGKGITAPNPKGQRLAIERCFSQLNYGPEGVGLLEAHGTSTKVGDVVEVNAAAELFKAAGRAAIGLGSVKSQIGHLKAAAGAAAIAKAALALHRKQLPPSINFKTPNPGIDWANAPFRVLTQAEDWKRSAFPRRAHVSSFGFGGTNFHLALEEAEPETVSRVPDFTLLEAKGGTPARGTLPLPLAGESRSEAPPIDLPPSAMNFEPAVGGEAFFAFGGTPDAVFDKLKSLHDRAGEGPLTALAFEFNRSQKRQDCVVALAAETPAKLKEKVDFVLKSKDAAIFQKAPPLFKTKSIYPQRGKKPGKIGFLFPGQGSQYVDMLKDLRAKYQVVADTFAEADHIMNGIIGRNLSDVLFTKGGETPEQLAEMEERIKQTEITQPAVLTADVAILRLLKSFGIEPDVVCGHSLGEYGALVAAGIFTFEDALLAVSSRAKEMAGVKVPDPGKMASIAAPLEKVEPVLKTIKGYVAPANKNCPSQTVIAGETKAVEAAVKKFASMGVQAVEIRVSHAFHSRIVQPAQAAYGRFLERMPFKKPQVQILSNVTAAYYPDDVKEVRKLLVAQIAEPVEFIRQIERMYKDGVRIFVEVGPKRVLSAFTTNILEKKSDAVALSSNHPKRGGILEFNDLLARITAEGVDVNLERKEPTHPGFYTGEYFQWVNPKHAKPEPAGKHAAPLAPMPPLKPAPSLNGDASRRFELFSGPVVVSGVSAGVPGSWDRLFRDNGLDQIIHGQNLIEALPEAELHKQLDKNLDRVKKSETGAHAIERLESVDQVMRLAGRAGTFDIAEEFGVRASVNSLMDVTAKMGLAAAILALKDAGLPLVHHYKRTTTGGMIPTAWGLPGPLQEGTGVILASAFPGIDSLIDDMTRYFRSRYAGRTAKAAWVIFDRMMQAVKDPAERQALADWYVRQKAELETGGEAAEYRFSRSFLFRILSLGHGQVAQFIKAKGPVTQINAACASTTQAIAMAEDWIRLGRCKRVVVMGVDDVTNSTTLEWIGTGFLASGATATHNVVSETALPFDRRRNGMIVGMGAVGLVVEDGRECDARGMRPLAELLASQFENSAYHVTRLNTKHVCATMERVVEKAERRHNLTRKQMASKMLFMSHETYTPAQGGSSSAEVAALKHVFREDVGKVVVTNTKGFTGHAMGASIEDAVAVRAMNLGKLPPIANYKEPDPELAGITLSRGGDYDCEYALRLGAGFGSQIALTLLRRAWKVGEPRIHDEARHQAWLKEISGEASPELEVVHNTLRLKDTGARKRLPAEGDDEPAAPARPRPTAVPASAAPTAAAPARAAVAVAAAPAVARDEAQVTKEVVALVSEKTGYPAEMLELDLDMEADLGIDTVKQAELIGILRDKYGISKQENLTLKDYPTLRHVIRFVMQGGGGGAAAAPAKAANGSSRPAAAVHSTPEEPVAPAPESKAPPSRGSGLSEDEVRKEVVVLVSEKTGYPAEMLELDLDMEADLGIDTVKQAELIGIIREKYAIPKAENLSLKDYPTLRHVIRFVLHPGPKAPESPLGGSGGASAAVAPAAEAQAAPAAAPSGEFKRWALAEEPRALSGKAALPKSGVVVAALSAAQAKPFLAALKKAGTEAQFARATADPEAAGKALAKALGDKPLQGLLYVPALALSEFKKSATPAAFDKAYREAVVELFALAKAGAPRFKDGAFLLTVAPAGAAQPLGGAVSGLAKALRRELPALRVQALSLDPKTSAQAAADAAVAELKAAFSGAEARLEGGKRLTPRLVARAAGGPALALGPKSVVVVTGGGQGLGAECAKELARRWKPVLFILGRTALGKDAAKWAAMSKDELKALKAELWERLKADKKVRATPALLEREFSKVSKAADVQRNLDAMRAAGAEVTYLACDLAMASAVAAAAKRIGAPDLVLHAAGLEESKLLADKTVERFDAVFRAKAHGAFHLLQGLKSKKGQRWVLFSSVVGRFGNVGQTDYAAASEFLAGLSGWLRGRGTPSVTIDLTAIAEIGMATRGGVEQFLKSQGVDFMPPKVAVELILAEAVGPMPDAEVVLAGKLGKLDSDGLMTDASAAASEGMVAPSRGATMSSEAPATNETAPTPARTTEAAPAAPAPAAARPAPKGRTLLDQVVEEKPGERVIAKREFSLEKDPWLADHSITGTPYVAGVMGLELFAATQAKLAGRVPAGFKDVRFALPIKLLRDKPITARVKAEASGLSIESDFLTPQGIRLGAPRVHFTAASVEGEAPSWTGPKLQLKAGAFEVGPDAIYSAYFHGPSFQVLEGFLSVTEKESLAVYKRPVKPLWYKNEPRLLFAPMLLEAAFQACGYRDLKFASRMTLPDSIDKVLVQPRADDVPERLYVRTVYLGPDGDAKSVYDAWVFDERHRVWAQLSGYRMIAVS